jgi:hypothetical protein
VTALRHLVADVDAEGNPGQADHVDLLVEDQL